MKLSAEHARERFADSPVAVLGTSDADGVAHLVPVTYLVSGDKVFIAVDDKPKRSQDLKRLRNIAANPRVCLLAQRYDDDWTRLWWARADGWARVVADYDLAPLLARYQQYRSEPPPGPAVVIEVDRWSGWSAE